MRRLVLSVVMLTLGAGLFAAAAHDSEAGSAVRNGGTFRISFQQGRVDSVDPALSYGVEEWSLLDATCARLMAYPDRPPPQGFGLVPEVAAALPRVSRDGRTYTFAIRPGFRFSNGTPVRASAFARQINRLLAPSVASPGLRYAEEIVGSDAVRAGRRATAAGVVARGNRLVVRLERPVPDFPAWTTMPFFCAVPPNLPVEPEGRATLPGAGPYYVAEHLRGRRIVLRENRFYGGTRPHRVDRFFVDLQAGSPEQILDRVERGEYDWGYATAPIYFARGRDLLAKYGRNRSRFFVQPGFVLRMLVFNSSRPLFRNNAGLRRAVNFALDRRALGEAASGALAERPTDQYLPPFVPGFRNANIYPLDRPNLRRARALARGNLRGGKAVMYVPNFPPPLALAQLARRQLARIGLDVELRPVPIHITNPLYSGRLAAPGEPWDIALALWTPDIVDPYAYLNRLFDGRFVRDTNLARFSVPKYNRSLRKAARLGGRERYRTYGRLDVQLARDAAPVAAIGFFNEATLVSRRVDRRCIVLRPTLDLTAVCLK